MTTEIKQPSEFEYEYAGGMIGVDVRRKYAAQYAACPYQWARAKNAFLRVRAMEDLICTDTGLAIIKAGEIGYCNPAGFFDQEFRSSPQNKPIGEGCDGLYVWPDVPREPRNWEFVIVKSSQIREA